MLETPVGATTATSAWRPGTAAEGVTAGVRAGIAGVAAVGAAKVDGVPAWASAANS